MTENILLRDCDQALSLGEALPEGETAREYKIFPRMKLFHPQHPGGIELNDPFFEGMQTSFTARGLDIQVDYNHASAGAKSVEDGAAAGWITSLSSKEDGLYAKIEWNEDGLKAIRSKKYRYLSPEFALGSFSRETGEVTNLPRLNAVALTNRPYLEKQQKLAASEPSATKEITQMSDPSKELEELRAAKAKAEADAAKNAETLASVLKFQRDQLISSAMSEGRVTPAMVPSVTSFADMCGADLGKLKSFLDVMPKLIGEAPKGNPGEQKQVAGPDTSKLSDADKRACRLFDHTEEEVAKFGEYATIDWDLKGRKFLVMKSGERVAV
jgi:phage I-like protein